MQRHWHQLPNNILESILSNCDLDYDSYEGSRAEEEDKFLNGYYSDMPWHSNYKMVQSYYDGLSNEDLLKMIDINIQSLRWTIEHLTEFKKKLV